MATTSARPFWIGTYPAPGQDAGSGEGIWRVDVAPDGTFGAPTLAATSSAPSFLALHPDGRTLYAVGETGEGTVSAFAVDGERLGDPVTISSGGDSPCHLLALDDVLWVANYGDGVVGAVPLTPAGVPAADAVRFPAPGGPGAHAHFCAVVGDEVVVADLGLDAVRRYPARPAAAGPTSEPVVAARLAPGSGPRHLVVLDDGSLVVAGELDARLHVLTPAGQAGWTPSSSVPAAGLQGETQQHPSHVTLTGDLLLLGVRGAEVLAVHRVARDADSRATLDHLADIDLGAGAWPRHHAVVGTAADGRLLVVVAHQGTSELASVLVDPATGAGEVAARLPFATPPACLLPAGVPGGEPAP